MAKKKGAVLSSGVVGVVLVAVIAAVGYSTFSGPAPTKVLNVGGGSLPGPAAPEAPYAISTLGPIGTAAQDPGGGGGGGGRPGSVAPPGIQGAQGSGGAQGFQGGGDTLYFSGVNLLDPNRSATTSGNNTFPGPAAVGGGVLGPALGTDATGCATAASSVEYDGIPLRIETIGFNGAPLAHVRITGGGPITVTLYQQSPGGACQALTSGSGSISGGATNIRLGSRHLTFTHGYTPVLVINAPSGSHTISTSSDNPSYLQLPGLFGV